MEVINDGKTILANNAEIIIPKKSVKINGKSAKFEKKKYTYFQMMFFLKII